MPDLSIEQRASFGDIRYARLWEDPEPLLEAFAPYQDGRYLSICSAGDNALALLLLDPKEVVAADISQAQLECLRLRIAAYRTLDQPDFLEFIGARPSSRRSVLFGAVLAGLQMESRSFWQARQAMVVAHGAGNIGKFERYFRLFRRHILPLVHDRKTVADVFMPRTPEGRRHFYERCWNTWRWRLGISLFFSRFIMGRLGRDPAFFEHVAGSAAAHVRRKIEFAAVTQDPSDNSYMQAILLGCEGKALPVAWRPEHYETIRTRLDRLTLVNAPVDATTGDRFDGFNLSDIFEYMTPAQMTSVYERLLDKAAPSARFVYWNMMVPRHAVGSVAKRVERLVDLEERLKLVDKAFFYSDLVIEEVRL